MMLKGKVLIPALIGMYFLLMGTFSIAGENIYLQQCSSCHAQDGSGNVAMKAPAIAGLDKEYLVRQLKNYKQGIRGSQAGDTTGMMMAGMAKSLSTIQIDSVSHYLSEKKFVSATPAKDAGGFGGRGLYMNCQSCHGAKAQGEKLLKAPRLAGQHIWYLEDQLKKFKSGLRGKHPEDKYGKQMHIISQDLDFDSQVKNILAYISHLKPADKPADPAH